MEADQRAQRFNELVLLTTIGILFSSSGSTGATGGLGIIREIQKSTYIPICPTPSSDPTAQIKVAQLLVMHKRWKRIAHQKGSIFLGSSELW